MFSTILGIETIPWDVAFHCHNRQYRLLPSVPFFGYVFILSNFQRDNIATTLYLVQPSISHFSSCILITPKPLLYGLGRMKKLIATALEISSVIQQSSVLGSGFSEGRKRRQQLDELLGETIHRRQRQQLLSK